MAISGLSSAAATALAVIKPTRTPPDQAGSGGGGNGINGAEWLAAFLNGTLKNTVENADVGAGGDLGDDTAKGGMFVNLGIDDVGQDLCPPIAMASDNGGGGLVAACLDA